MLRVTWEWIGLYDPAFDVANTVAVANGTEHDLLAPPGEYERWAGAAATQPALEPDEASAFLDAQTRVLALREHVRAVMHATSDGRRPPASAVAALNEASGAAPQSIELTAAGDVHERLRGTPVERLLAKYARSAIRIAATGSTGIRVCGAPSCGMFYPPGRRQQRWCSVQCGTRARVARHYRPRRSAALRDTGD